MTPLGVVIPAANEALGLPATLAALLASEPVALDVVVVSNGSTDGTARVAEGFAEAFAARGWRLRVLDLAEGSKPAALDAGDALLTPGPRAYLDADVAVSPPLLPAIFRALGTAPYASGRPEVVGTSLPSRLYARAWSRTPFMARGVPGCGLFALSEGGRARWGRWPRIVADDAFARLHFAPAERALVPHSYRWPVAEGLSALVRVRRRQDRGMRELLEKYPSLGPNGAGDRAAPGDLARMVLNNPAAGATYLGVALATRLTRDDNLWSRGR